MKNITLAIDEGVLREVRKYAADHGTTVNALVREALQRVADRAMSQREGWENLFKLADESGVEVGEITWKREDLYER